MGYKLRILHVSKRYWPFVGGVERYVRDLAVAQRRAGHDVRVLTIDHDVLGVVTERLPRREAHEGIDVWRVHAVGGQRKQVLAEWPSEVLRQVRRADVIHHHDPRFLLETVLTVAGLARRPVIFHTHGMILHTRAYYRLKRLVLRGYYGPLLSVGTAAIVAGSQADATLMAEYCGIGADRVRLFLNAIDLERYGRIDRRPAAGRLLCFGRIDVHKGLDRLLDVLAAVPGSWQLDVAGEGPRTVVELLRRRAATLGLAERVTWHGRVSDENLDELLAQAALVLFPSRFEGFGLALVEALAAGCPVLASEIPSHREILASGLPDRLLDFDSPDASRRLAAVLATGVADPSGTTAVFRAQAARFSIERLAGQIEGLYHELGLADRASTTGH